MILVDTNILVYAHVISAPHHDRARPWFDTQLAEGIRVGLPWHSLFGFVRIITNPRIFSQPLSVQSAWQLVRSLAELDNVEIPQPTGRHASIVGQLLAAPGIGYRHVMDTHIAALAIEHGLTLCSSDGGFARYPGLRWIDPLA